MVVSVKVNLAPAPINVTQFVPGSNTPANGAQLFSYTAGSSTKQTCYTTSSGTVAWSNPIILDSGGNLTGSHEVWLAAGQVYDFTLAPSTDTDPPVSPYWTVQNLTGINDTTITSTEWIGLGSSTFAFVNASTFTVGGDVTGTLTPQRRLKTVNTAGTLYSTITSSVFSVSTTTIGIQSDSTGIDSGLSSVNYGLINSVNNSLPQGSYTASTLTVTTLTAGGVSTFNSTVSLPTISFQNNNTAPISAGIYRGTGFLQVRGDTSGVTFNNSTNSIINFQVNDAGTASVRGVLTASGFTMTTDSLLTVQNQTITGGASTGTFTNSPHAGNPTAWVRIVVNGSTLCFPCFATT